MDSVTLMWVLGYAAQIFGVFIGDKSDCLVMVHVSGGQPIRLKRARLEEFLNYLETQSVARESMIETTEEVFAAYAGITEQPTYDWTGQ